MTQHCAHRHVRFRTLFQRARQHGLLAVSFYMEHDQARFHKARQLVRTVPGEDGGTFRWSIAWHKYAKRPVESEGP